MVFNAGPYAGGGFTTSSCVQDHDYRSVHNIKKIRNMTVGKSQALYSGRDDGKIVTTSIITTLISCLICVNKLITLATPSTSSPHLQIGH